MFKGKTIKKKETKLADLEISHSIKMPEDAKNNASQARSSPEHCDKVV